MNNLFAVSLNRMVSPGLALLTAIVLLAPCAAQATPYVVKLTQQGSNVVATGSGEIDLTGLTFSFSVPPTIGIVPSTAELATGTPGNSDDLYTGFTGPASFGSGGGTLASNGSGDMVGVFVGAALLGVPNGYVSGSSLSSGAIWDNHTFASLGVTPGTYTWTWGTGGDQSFALEIGTVTAVPEPAALGIFGLGMLLIGGSVTLRRREQRQA